MIKVKVNNEYKDVVKIFCGGTLQKEIIKVWSREAQGYVYESSVEYTGTLPITINTNGDALLDYRVYGADGGVGVATVNLWDNYFANGTYEPSGFKPNSFHICGVEKIPIKADTQYSISYVSTYPYPINRQYLYEFDAQGERLRQRMFEGKTFTTSSDAAFCTISVGSTTAGIKPDDISNFMLIEGSTAPDSYIPYGYKLPMVVHSELKDIGDTVSVNGDLWDIVNYNNDFTRATLLRHELIMVPSVKQAIFAFPSGLAAGDYHFTIAQHSWFQKDVGKTLTFTLTQAIPEGGQLVLNGAYTATLVGTTISSYASPTATMAIETVTMTEGDSGTDLGSLTNAGTPASNINSLQRALLGSNEWKTSEKRQYLNSDKAAGSVWTPQTIYDRPPAWATNTAGFMNGLDEDFLSCVADTTYVTVRNTISDGGGTDTLTDKFYLPSRTEIFGTNEIKNTPEGTLYKYYVNATDADRIKKYHANTAKSWRLRTPTTTNAYYTCVVAATGAFGNSAVFYAPHLAPACQIDLTRLSNSWLQNNMYKSRATTTPVYIGENQLGEDEYVSYGEQKIYRDVDGTLTPTDPPVPLPEIPTIDGATIIDYDGTPKPSQMYVKYRR